ncbi:FkbM family methyltransferase [Polynucleobacter sp. UB-Piko-W3]|uniref:FkbM family methyltransferase n=1 Tax=Polynucleobacter sp. UB-Piko-W3 TaxID=1819735 RepID=UPI001C0D78B3|nr:FkbM family methyltransferase [Polynucleobacter sp. UB-Piko-W3]MBU3553986.1 FkbM family methyltransferase [Polynucleobacter sp. UB-Piko-W3]
MKKIVQKFFNLFGFKLSRLSTEPTELSLKMLMQSFKIAQIDLVIDVGANAGQYAQRLRFGGYRGKIISIEPLKSAHEQLLVASRNDPNWDVLPRCALGAINGEIEINISKNSVSSSILPMMSAHLDSAPESIYIGKEFVPMFTLDDLLGDLIRGHKGIFLKIDTQGLEWEVLNGASQILPVIKGIQLELSFLELYEGQRLWHDFIDFLSNLSFNFWSMEPAFIDHETGRTMQVDGVFFR